jgi:hypothetical protein
LQVGLSKVVRTTIGFGPFTILHRKVVPEAIGIGLHRLLQRLADQGVPGVRSTGRFHLVHLPRNSYTLLLVAQTNTLR